MRLYLASSWRNPYQPTVLEALRTAGHDVYDFRNAATAMGWKEIDPELATDLSARRLRSVLAHPKSEVAFEGDFQAMKACEAGVLLLPCGLSAHLEAGWLAGAGKPVMVLAPEIKEPELMYKLFDVEAVLLRPGDVTPVFATVGEVCSFLDNVRDGVYSCHPRRSSC